MIKPDDGYITFIVNPKSGARHSGLHTRPLEKYFASKGFDVRANLTKSLDDACDYAVSCYCDDCQEMIRNGQTWASCSGEWHTGEMDPEDYLRWAKMSIQRWRKKRKEKRNKTDLQHFNAPPPFAPRTDNPRTRNY